MILPDFNSFHVYYITYLFANIIRNLYINISGFICNHYIFRYSSTTFVAEPQEPCRFDIITEEDNELIELPLLSFGISKTKKEIMEKISNGETAINKIAKMAGISRAMTYHHIRELKGEGFIEDKDGIKLTTAGKLAIL